MRVILRLFVVLSLVPFTVCQAGLVPRLVRDVDPASYAGSSNPRQFFSLNEGFGFTAFMMYLIYIARGEHATAHYAICTGFMALGLMVPGLWSGKLQEMLGYPHFFICVMLATIPGFIVTALIPLDAGFGKKARKS